MKKNKKKYIGFGIIMTLITIITISIIMSHNEMRKIVEVARNDSHALEDEEQVGISRSNSGDVAIVSSANIIERKTGTAPFDDNDEEGNDSSENNDIVRSFDKVSWLIDATMRIKDGETITNVKGGYLNIEVTLPEACANAVKWDLDSMNWTEGTETISEDQRTFTAKYHMNENEITAPGKQTLSIALNVLGMANQTEIVPEFKLWLEENSEKEKYTLSDPNAIKVSATPKYNIQLKRNTYTSNKVTVNYDGEDKIGRIYGYSVVIQLYNEDEDKGMKGIEIPKGDINFDINLKLERTLTGKNELEDISQDYMPMLWNYKINAATSTGNIPDRDMFFENVSGRFARDCAPLGMATKDREESIYNSGNIEMTQNGNVIATNIKNYQFDGQFPKYNFQYSGAIHEKINYTDNIGCFSAGYMQLFVPLSEELFQENRKCYLTVEDSNMNMSSASGKNINVQVLNTDDLLKVEHEEKKKGTYGQTLYISRENLALTSTSVTQGDGFAYVGENLFATNKFVVGSKNESDVYTVNKLIAFDGEAVEPEILKDGSKYKLHDFDGSMKFRVLYLCKKDGSNWNNQEEMNKANIEELEWYENISDIPENKLCIGVYVESIDGNCAVSSGGNNVMHIPLKVKTTATPGKVYGFSEKTQMWEENLDRSIYTIDNIGNFTYPTASYDSGNSKYQLSEYDEDGNYLKNNEYRGGTSLLILSAKQEIKVQTLDKEGNEKINYDLGRNESEVTYKISPSLTKYSNEDATIDGVTVKITDTLPKGLKYVPGSEQIHGEPDIIENDDGTTTLIWYMYNCTVGDNIESIVFKVKIDEEIPNSTKLINKAVIWTDKIGNARIETRTVEKEIQVTNLASHRLYKTTDAPIVEKNQQIHYQIVYQNKTSSQIHDFQMLDILPYNGDNRGSNFKGTYNLDDIQITQTNLATNQKIENDNLNLYITKDESVRHNVTVKDTDLGTNAIWQEKTIGDAIGEEAMAYAIKGTIQQQEKIVIDLYLTPRNNEAKDKYVNSVTAQVYADAEEMTTNTISVDVVKRLIEGNVWFDENADGIINEGESYLNDINVTLLNSDGTIAKDFNGNEIQSVKTNTDGYYKFEDMPKGEYKVKVEEIGDIYEITKKEVGINQEINSKFNADLTTDILDKLNTVQSPELKESHINAGIKLKDTSVLVHYYIEGTTTSVSEDVILEGRINDKYETSIAKDIPSKYELVSTPSNSAGSMTKDQIVVTYYYRLKDTSVLVHHYVEGTTTSISNDVTINGKVDDEYTTSLANDIPTKYELVSMPSNATGTMEEKQIVVTYYYRLKDARVVVKYLEKDTNEVVAQEEVINGKVDSKYDTDKKEIENYTCVEDTKNTKGIMTENEIIVIYYYLQNAKVTVQYIDKNTGERLIEDEVKTGLVGDTFETNSKEFNDYILVEEPEEKNGIMQKNDIVLTYYYVHVSEGVREKHIDIKSKQILANELHEGNEGDPYNIVSRTFEGYDLVESSLPDNSTGTMKKEVTEVTYYYIKKAEVVVQYIDKTTGEKLAENVVYQGHEGDSYETENKEFDNYDLIKIPENAQGDMPGGTTTITYEYKHQSKGVIERHYDVKTNELLSETRHEGHEGDTYTISVKEFENYDVVEESLPTNAQGSMTKDEIEVNYYYIRKTTVVVKYIDKFTNKEIEEEKITGHEGDEYEVVSKEIDGYELLLEELPKNEKGVMTKEEITVTYYYIGVNSVKRLIEGNVWLDENADGIINEGETYLNAINVILLNSDGTVAKDANGNDIPSVKTNTNGYYKFEDVPKGEYKVKVEIGNIYEITKKEVGSNQEINSKFNADGTTDILTKLNSVESTELKESHINAGIKLKDTSVLVHHYIEGTTTQISEDVILEGRINDKYETSIAKDIPSKYELVSTPSNSAGSMEKDQIVVIYYYRVKDASVLVHYYIEGTNTSISNDVTINGKVDDEYTTSLANDIPTKYELVSMPANATGTMQVEQIVVTYYYRLKDARVVVKYLEKDTNEVVAQEEIINGKVDSEYDTDKKEIENYTCVAATKNRKGTMTEEEIIVIYYYLQNTKVTVQYIDKNTGEKLIEDEVKTGLVGDTFETNSKEFKDYILVEEPEEKSGVMQKEEIVLTYYYAHVSGGVLEKHIDIKSKQILANELHEGNEGDSYSIASRTFEGYDLVESSLPDNSTGTMKKEVTEVIYYYIKKAEVVVQYIDKISEEKLIEDVVYQGHEGDSYETENKEFDNYDLIKVPKNAQGDMPGGTTTVTYEYKHKSKGVIERHYDVKTNELLNETKHEGHEGDTYTTSVKEFENYDVVEESLPTNAQGSMTKDEIEVNYYYIRKTTVVVKYIEKATDKEIEQEEKITGHEGDEYEVVSKEIEGYELLEEELPENEKGTMTKEEITVVYYYIRAVKVEVRYVDKTTQKELLDRDIIEGYEGKEYKVEPKEIPYYNLVDSTNNTEGIMKVEIIKQEDGTESINNTIDIIYYYEPLKFNLKVDKKITKLIVNGVERLATNGDLEKVEIHRKRLNEETVKVEYLIKVINDKELEGKATLVEKIPDGFTMNPGENSEWQMQNGMAQIEIENIKPNEEKEYKVVLEWTKGESNTGTKENTAYLGKVENEAGYQEESEEDNTDTAAVIISVATGSKEAIIVSFITISSLVVYVVILQGKKRYN